MALRAARLLSLGWRRSSRRWWWGTAATMALVLSMVLVVQGTFAGVDGATQERISAYFTGDLRVTASAPSAAPSSQFADPARTRASLQEAAGPDAEVTMQLESQFILSRRSLLQAYLDDDAQYPIGTPGSVPAQDFFGVGVLIGMPLDSPAASAGVSRYLVAGSLPDAGHRVDEEVQLLMAVNRYRDYLTPEEKERLGDPPDASAFPLVSFEMTAAYVDETAPVKDLLRFPARVVGLYETDLDALDTFTLVAGIEDVRRLVGQAPEGDAANVAIVRGGDSGAAAKAARASGWSTEDSDGFSARYIGEIVGIVKGLSLLLAALFFALPLFLVWHGITQQLAMHQREVAVCQAIGVGPGTLGAALALQVAWTLGLACALAAILVTLAARMLEPALDALGPLPVPIEFDLEAAAVVLVAVAAVGATVLALAFTLVRVARGNVASALRVA